MIVEKMEASLVLLAHRLCIPLQEVVTLEKLVRKDENRVKLCSSCQGIFDIAIRVQNPDIMRHTYYTFGKVYDGPTDFFYSAVLNFTKRYILLMINFCLFFVAFTFTVHHAPNQSKDCLFYNSLM